MESIKLLYLKLDSIKKRKLLNKKENWSQRKQSSHRLSRTLESVGESIKRLVLSHGRPPAGSGLNFKYLYEDAKHYKMDLYSLTL